MIPPFLVCAALVLDAALGDPVTLWHPVRWIGAVARRVEDILYRRGSGLLGGALATVLVVVICMLGALAALKGSAWVHPRLEDVAEVFLVYFSIAMRDLVQHAKRVSRALAEGSLVRARDAVGMMVGRDTADLDESEITRATVESVAESTVDAVTAPLFFAFLFGPLGAWGYRVINTLDSMWGHRDARYSRFGSFAARADDVLNYLPARLTLLGIALAAALRGLRGWRAFECGVKHGGRHSSPNSGLVEAGFAGALGVELGGANVYDGLITEGPRFGVAVRVLDVGIIREAVALSVATVACVTIGLFGLEWCGRGVLAFLR
jgi:adenosylcobinamide-phosphate synthase